MKHSTLRFLYKSTETRSGCLSKTEVISETAGCRLAHVTSRVPRKNGRSVDRRDTICNIVILPAPASQDYLIALSRRVLRSPRFVPGGSIVFGLCAASLLLGNQRLKTWCQNDSGPAPPTADNDDRDSGPILFFSYSFK